MEFDHNDTPYIRLPSPHDNIIINPPRLDDADVVCAALNDPRVYMYLISPPFPYRREDWESYYPVLEKVVTAALGEWREVERVRLLRRQEQQHASTAEGDVVKWVGSGLPVTVIREIDAETGEEKRIGDITVRKADFLDIKDEGERKRVKEENEKLEAGDPRIQWEVGFYLSPTAFGRGIMPAALRTLMDGFLIPYMNIHHLIGAYFDQNNASRRVFEKTGFFFEKFAPDVVELPESKTGVKGRWVGMGIMRWERVR